MELFSEREGFKKPKNILQIESIDDDLKNRLWNAIIYFFLEGKSLNDNAFYKFSKFIWMDYFNKHLDEFPSRLYEITAFVKNYLFSCKWHEIYRFTEYLANTPNDPHRNGEFRKHCNNILERELSAWRFVENKLVRISSEEEIASVEEALNLPSPFGTVRTHIKQALELLSDKESPDYRNSIKESISAVEATCILLTGQKKAKLGQALKLLKQNKIKIHPALEKSFSSLYGYTSDADGIRHSLLEDSNLNFEDAKFMFVSCSSFVNYLIGKSAKAVVSLNFCKIVRVWWQ